MKKNLFVCGAVCLFLGVFSVQVSARSPLKTGDPLADSAVQANRRTAIRCLNLAKNYASESDWNSVLSQCTMGISYDGTLSDLWYMLAVAENVRGMPKASVRDHVAKSLECNQWVDYNRDAARILYADILSETRQFEAVPLVLDGSSAGEDALAYPYIYSSDAEYIRAKAFYRIGTAAAKNLARAKIDYARKTYPSDSRFAMLFFTYENPNIVDSQVSKLADFFVSQLSSYKNAPEELDLYASRFADGKIRANLLKAYNARGSRHALYSVLALQSGILDEKSAFAYIKKFADAQVDYDILLNFLAQLTDEGVKAQAAQYFNAFAGTIARDTNGDRIPDLSVKYSRGRPQYVFFDGNQDDVLDWSINCDFGIPVSGTLLSERMDFTWEQFPYVKSVSLKNEASQVVETFDIINQELSWSPLRMDADEDLSFVTGTEFFFPTVNVRQAEYSSSNAFETSSSISIQTLLKASNAVTIPSKERDGASIRFTIIDGKVHLAAYFQNGTMYAQAQFKNGEPQLRVVDADGDGIFETTEFYAMDSDGSMDVHSFEEEQVIMTNLFGTPSSGPRWYLRMVQVDSASDADSVPDYTEEYLSRGGKICSWDTDGDGKWNIRFVRHGRETDSAGKELPVTEESMFYDYNDRLITITSRGGIPVSVKSETEELKVLADSQYKFYWLGQDGGSALAKKVLVELNQNASQGVCIVMNAGDGRRVMGIRIGDFCYGKIVLKEAIKDDDSETPEKKL